MLGVKRFILALIAVLAIGAGLGTAFGQSTTDVVTEEEVVVTGDRDVVVSDGRRVLADDVVVVDEAAPATAVVAEARFGG